MRKLNINDYKSSLPDFLLEIIDNIIKHDKADTLRFRNIKHPIDRLISARQNFQNKKHCWVFIDFQGNDNIIEIFGNQGMEIQQPVYCNETITFEQTTIEEYKNLVLNANKYFQKLICPKKLKLVSQIYVTNLDILRLRAQSNKYFTADKFIKDLKKVFSWNLIYRTHSKKSIQYISSIFDYSINYLKKKGFAKRFQQKKLSDITKLLKYQLDFKIQSKVWPSIPTQFRQYQNISEYKPVPKSRVSIIQKKLLSKKVPLQCPSNCSCLSDNFYSTCNFSLVQGTWQSECNNRKNRIQCSHNSIENEQKCKNSQIKNKLRKTCKTNPTQTGQFDIQECLIWGIDIYTRKNIFYLLPEIDIHNLKLQGQSFVGQQNTENKFQFIQKTLLKAMNFLGNDGFDMKLSCQFILNNSKQIQNKQQDNYQWKYQQLFESQQNQNYMFSNIDRYYAQCLLKAIQHCPDKEAFRIYSKGKGARCLNKNGIIKSQLITQYFGEIYETWRWYQKQDSTKKFMKQLKMNQSVPDFYNIYLEKHKDQIDGYDILVVDPINKGNFASRFSHSCSPNCGTITTVSNGKYYIGMYALRQIKYGQELTFDYCSMTESNYEHKNAICLCGTKLCRGNYLQLGNSKTLNVILDKYYCFQNRTSSLLKSNSSFQKQDEQICARYNIKNNILSDCPEWLKKWISSVIQFLDFEKQSYKQYILKNFLQMRPNKNQNQSLVPTDKEELYAQVYKSDLFQVRYQNLITTIDKLKYLIGQIKDQNPPLQLQKSQIVFQMLWSDNESIINQLKKYLLKYEYKRQVQIIQLFQNQINKQQCIQDKLFMVRYCYLYLSHKLKINKLNNSLQNVVISDIIYFYAFTHTYFTPHQYKPFSSEPVAISTKQILNFSSKKDQSIGKEKQFSEKKSYPAQFIWGQIVSWYKQTIAQPQASLSQDRRGTLTYPTIQTIIKSNTYPFQGNNRINFLKSLSQKPYASWPPQKCPWSYKNLKKTYGTFLFQSYYNADKLKQLKQFGQNPSEQYSSRILIHNVIKMIDQSFNEKLRLFIRVEQLLRNKTSLELRQKLKINYYEQELQESKRPVEQIEEGKKCLKKIKSHIEIK